MKPTTQEPVAEPGQAVAATQAQPAEAAAPAVYVKTRKKRKKRYTRDTKELQKLERGASRAAARVVSALGAGLTTYSKKSRKSAGKRRDGAIRDALENWALGAGKTMRKASKAPYDLASRIGGKTWRRQSRAVSRVVTPLLFLR